MSPCLWKGRRKRENIRDESQSDSPRDGKTVLRWCPPLVVEEDVMTTIDEDCGFLGVFLSVFRAYVPQVCFSDCISLSIENQRYFTWPYSISFAH